MSRFLFRLCLALLLLDACVIAGLADPVFPRGMQVGLEPVGNLKPSERIAGFEDADRKVAVAVAELPAPAYEQVERSFFGSPPPGFSDVKRESFAFKGGVGFLVSAVATEDGVAARRFLLLANASVPSPNPVVVVNIVVPNAARDVYTDDAIRRMLATVTFRKPPIDEQLALMPFTLKDLAGFRVMQVLPAGGAILTDGPDDDISRQPYMLVSVGRGAPDQASDRDRFARDLLANTPLREIAVKSAEDLRINGRPGFEIKAEAKGMAGEPLKLVQWVYFVGTGFVRVIGASRSEAWDQLYNRFRAVRDGVELR